jgi:hypothetical protein
MPTMAKKRRKKVSAKTQLRRLHKKADKAVSLYVRHITGLLTGGKCALCLERPVQACFHFIRRKRKILRWSPINLTASCHFCNYFEYRHPDPSRGWFIRNRGVVTYLKLIDESAKSFDPTPEYLQGIIDLYTQRLAELKKENL